jgi:hypothetical protein
MVVKYDKTTLWLADVSTEGIADDDESPINQVMICTGTKMYKAGGGRSKTVMVLEPLDMKPLAELWRKYQDSLKEEPKPKKSEKK